MFELPSIWNIAVSTLVFFIAAWYLNRWLDGQAIPKGVARSLTVFVLAYFLSWGSGELADWAQDAQPKPDSGHDAAQLLQRITGAQH